MIHNTRHRIELGRVFHEEEAVINKKLPKELLLRIFSYLDVVSLCRCAQVSKTWNVLALDGSNWQRIDLFNFQTDVEGSVIENLSRRCGGFLRKLSLRGCQSVEDGSMRTLAGYCINVEDLNLNGCKNITDATCQSLARHCKKLSRLDLGSCSKVTDFSLKTLADGTPNLTHINISWCEAVTENGVEALARGCPKLKSFISKGCLQITDKAIACLAQYCPHLEVVNLHGCVSVEDSGVTKLAQCCPGLHNVCLSGCVRLTDASLVALAQHCHSLSTLEVAGCAQFTDTGFQALARNCRLLEKMDLEECVLITDQTLIHLAMGCPRLEKLLLSHIFSGDSCPLLWMPMLFAHICDCELLLLTRIFVLQKRHQLVSTSTNRLLEKPVDGVGTRSLSHCELITDDGIRSLGTSPCSAEHLTVLELDNCPLITDTSLEHLITCHNLQRVELYDCQLITRAGIRRLRNHLPNIRVHAYFAPVTPPPNTSGSRQRYCRCCAIL